MKIKFSFVAIALIIFLSLIPYINIFRNEFVWDDYGFILENPDIRSFSNAPLFFMHDVDGLYRPLRTLHYTFVYSFGKKNVFWYHLNAVFFHTMASILVFLIIFSIFGRKNIALVAALIFAAHPIHTDRVTNITAGFDLFGIIFMLISFYLYIRFSKNNGKIYFLSSLAVFLIAVFSSEEAVTLPLLIILYEFSFNKEKFSRINIKNNLIRNLIKNYAPFFAAALFYIIIRFFVLGIRGRVEEYLAGNFYLTMLTMLKAYVNYILLLIYPVNLTLFHDLKPATSFFNFEVLGAFLVLAAILFFTIKNYRNKALFFSVFWFFIALLPMSNILPLQVFMAERYLYVPSIAFSLLASYALFELYNLNFKEIKNKKFVKYGIMAFIVFLLGFYIATALNRNEDWRDNLTLWSKTAATNPENSMAHGNLGFTYEQNGDIKKALDEFEIAVKLMPDNFKALANLGVAYAKFGRYNESIEILKKSIEIKKYYKTYDKLGLVYDELKMEEQAIEKFDEAISLNQRYAKAYNDLATVYGKMGKFNLALENFNKAVQIDKDYADAHYNLGILLEFLGEKDRAREEFEIAARLEPENKLIAGRKDRINEKYIE